MIENDLIFFETKIKIKINFYKFTSGDLDHLKDQVQLKDLDLFHQDQLILNNPVFLPELCWGGPGDSHRNTSGT